MIQSDEVGHDEVARILSLIKDRKWSTDYIVYGTSALSQNLDSDMLHDFGPRETSSVESVGIGGEFYGEESK